MARRPHCCYHLELSVNQMNVEMDSPAGWPPTSPFIPYGWRPPRCDRCRQLTKWFGRGASCNEISLENCCRVCSLEKAVFEARAVVHAVCAPWRMPSSKRLPVRVLRHAHLETLIWEYAIGTPKLCEMHVQEHIWMKMLQGKYVWDFDCGEAVRDPFSGFFGVNSVNLVGDGKPVQLWVLWGTELAKRHRTRDLRQGHRNTILHLVIRYLGPFQHWMIR